MPLGLVVSTKGSRDNIGNALANCRELRVQFVDSGQAAIEAIGKRPFQFVLTDLYTSIEEGQGIIPFLRENFPTLPVIIMAVKGGEHSALAALQGGAIGFVSMRNLDKELPTAIELALDLNRATAHKYRVLGRLTKRTARFVIENDSSLIPPLVALLREDLLETGICDDHEAMRVGLALEEALLNAIYHGNLEVSSDLKQVSETAFQDEVKRKAMLSPYKERRVRVLALMSPTRALFDIQDGGPGFDITSLPDPEDPEALLCPSGRGLLMMRLFMDKVLYNDPGNRVRLIKYRKSEEA